MLVYLKHPIHGTKIAVCSFELAEDIKNGWEEFIPGAIETGGEMVGEKMYLKTTRKPKVSNIANDIS
jgi:hypothetical protein